MNALAHWNNASLDPDSPPRLWRPDATRVAKLNLAMLYDGTGCSAHSQRWAYSHSAVEHPCRHTGYANLHPTQTSIQAHIPPLDLPHPFIHTLSL